MVVDSFFKWPEICLSKKPTSSTVTNFLHELFVRFGIPDITVSDNGMQFVSYEFKKFHKMFTAEHVTMALYHPRSNGQTECFVDMFKRALRKSNKEIMVEVALEQFLRVVQLPPSSSTSSSVISKFASLVADDPTISSSLGVVPRAPIITGTIFTLVFWNLFISLAKLDPVVSQFPQFPSHPPNNHMFQIFGQLFSMLESSKIIEPKALPDVKIS
ncbi:uncharacterized protein K02A2.6-like [Octopus bimaculoides]|uniref:uncharacterized protein K02A2.6-like n=1 Tax=Octopus bimaculoides TaxID=37653 RepID=UPI00071DF00E|nr:uncharacterized protein K02A2.6-like [Octopus bimaculoides]|eukprot:XP_014770047.1 PREDICTED: uncharacterized protein K02A2.6-like [Octopus bimaculoides]